jgi:4-oxalomesaconate tautomerase
MWMRGGTSKGGYFLADDLPSDPASRDDLLLRVMGSPDARQIDGLGGAHPLTSKVAIVSRSSEPGFDVDYLFLQIVVDDAVVRDQQNCGNILAGVGPFAIERGLVSADVGETRVRIRLVNAGGTATATVQTPGGRPTYAGDTEISGVPGSAAPVVIEFEDTVGSSCGALLPTGRAIDVFDGIEATCIDAGMPVVVLRAKDLDLTGDESPGALEANTALRERIESIRLQAGPAMNLGDVRELTIPKMSLVSTPSAGGQIRTRTFIPHRCHDAIGVLGAVSVASAAFLDGSPAASVARRPPPGKPFCCEHPTGGFEVVIEFDDTPASDGAIQLRRAGVVRTARKLFDGLVFPR